MQNVNWWLMALAFALGLVLTLALMIRRVKREVPEYATLAAGASAAGAGAAAAGAAGAVEALRRPRGCRGGRAVRCGFGPGRGDRHRTGRRLHDQGQRGLDALPHAREPGVPETVAEVWFRDVETAEKAGFARWDSGKSQRGQR